MANKNPLYWERLKRIGDTVKLRIPDRVPVFPVIEQWAQFQAGISVRDSFLKDPKLIYEAYKQVYEDVYVDASYGTGNTIPVKMIENIGNGLYQVTDKGVQIMGGKGLIMDAEDYPAFIEDPYRFLMSKALPRKYPKLAEDRKSVEKTWMHAIKDAVSWKFYDKKSVKMIENDLGVPHILNGRTLLPPDFFLDFLRDFSGISSDLRRCPEQLKAACEALMPTMKKLSELSDSHPGENTYTAAMLHLPTYIRTKDFEYLYWPFMKEMAEFVKDRGSSIFYACESDWTRYTSYLQDLPSGHVAVQMDDGDILEYKRALEGKIAIGGGMQQSLLKLGTVEECLDRAKWLLDNIAPGGGYVFGLDKNLLNETDAKRENLAAVTQYVHENGVY